MFSRLPLIASALLLIAAIWIASRTAEAPQNIGIDFVQFWMTGNHVASVPSSSVYSSTGREMIMETTWERIQAEKKPSRFLNAARFRHQGELQTYSSPFLYSAFAVLANVVRLENPCWDEETDDRRVERGPADHLKPNPQYSVSCEYEEGLRWFWLLGLCSSAFACIAFGMATRSVCTSMLFGAAILVWYNPLRSDINVGNVNQLQFGMLGVLVAILNWPKSAPNSVCNSPKILSYRDAAAAFWFSVCLAFKPTLLWCGIMFLAPAIGRVGNSLFRNWLFHRQSHKANSQTVHWANECGEMLNDRQRLVSAVVGGVQGAAAAIGFSLIWFPLQSWPDWIDAVRSMPDEFILTTSGNHSPTYLLRHSMGVPQWLVMMMPVVLTIAILGTSSTLRSSAIQASRIPADSPEAAVIGRAITESHVTNDIRLIAMGCQIALLTSHLVWFHYLVLSLPAFLVLLPQVTRHEFTIGRRTQTGLGLLLCLCLIGLQPFDRFMHPAAIEHVVQTAVANAILLVMLAWSHRQLPSPMGT